jgi:hypothetical protein
LHVHLQYLENACEAIPDGFVERVFLALDRSTNALARVEASLERYLRHLDGGLRA